MQGQCRSPRGTRAGAPRQWTSATTEKEPSWSCTRLHVAKMVRKSSHEKVALVRPCSLDLSTLTGVFA